MRFPFSDTIKPYLEDNYANIDPREIRNLLVRRAA